MSTTRDLMQIWTMRKRYSEVKRANETKLPVDINVGVDINVCAQRRSYADVVSRTWGGDICDRVAESDVYFLDASPLPAFSLTGNTL